jgi:hypothetical protein
MDKHAPDRLTKVAELEAAHRIELLCMASEGTHARAAAEARYKQAKRKLNKPLVHFLGATGQVDINDEQELDDAISRIGWQSGWGRRI